MSTRFLPTVLAGTGAALCVAEVISAVQIAGHPGPENYPYFALGFAALFGLGAWLLRTGRTTRDLGLSVKTVQNYVSRILDKLQVSDRTQAALRARDARPR